MLTAFPIGLTVLLAAAAPLSAPAGDTIPIRVEFDAPAGCSSADIFYGGLLARMSRTRRAMPGEAAIRLGVHLTRAGNKIRGELRLMDGGPGDGDTRRVEGETCDAVVEVLSLTAALALVTRPPAPLPPPPPPTPHPPAHPSSSSQSSSSSSQSSSAKPPDVARPLEPEEKPPEPEEQPAAVEVVPAKPPEPPGRARFHAGLQAVAADLISSSISLGGGLALRLERSPAEGAGASIGLTFFYASNDLLQNPDAIDADWAALAAVACPGWSIGRTVTVQPCAQAIGGWLAAKGHNLTNPSSVGRTWWSAGALLRAVARLGAGFSLELDAGATIPIVKRRFIITTPEGTVGETPTVAPMLTLGLSRFF